MIVLPFSILANQKNKRKFYELFCPNYIVKGGIILRNSSQFEEWFPLNHNVLGWIIFNEWNQRNMCKFDDLLPPIYFVSGGNILYGINWRNRHKFDELFPTILGGIIFNEANQWNMCKWD